MEFSRAKLDFSNQTKTNIYTKTKTIQHTVERAADVICINAYIVNNPI